MRRFSANASFSVLLFTLWCLAPSATAQTTGTISVSGSVGAILKLTSGGAATLSGNVGGGVTTQSAADGALATVVNFGDVGPGNSSTYVCFTQPVFLRSNVGASVKGAVTAATFGPGAADLQKSDIGIGVQNLAAGGPNADISTTTIVAAFATDPCAAPVAGGVPTFSRTLNDLVTAAPGTTLISAAGPWSSRGSFASPSNRVLVDLRLAIVPQAFTAGTFSATITLTMTAP